MCDLIQFLATEYLVNFNNFSFQANSKRMGLLDNICLAHSSKDLCNIALEMIQIKMRFKRAKIQT